MTNPFFVIATLVIKNIISNCLQDRDEIIFAYLHGSLLDHHHFNDIDIAGFLHHSKAIDPEKAFNYEMKISLILERELGKPVDFHVLNFTSAAFAYHATAGELIFSRDDQCRYEFLERTWMIYFDYRHFVKAFMEDLATGTQGDGSFVFYCKTKPKYKG